MTTQPPAQVKRATAGFAISLIAGVLILIGGLAIFAIQAFVSSTLHSFGLRGFPFSIIETALNTFGAIGLVCGIIVIIGAILIYMPGKEIAGGILVIIFSLISIISLGGFIIGLILGIIGGALGLAKK